MAVIHVPRPSKKKAMDPDRPVSSLLLTQVRHLQHAERRLPLRYRTEIYTHAIRTERQAAAYIREMTEAIHRAHEDADLRRKGRRTKRRGMEIAAAAETPKRKLYKKELPRKKAGNSAKKRAPKKK
jgi:hypothetical protein